MSESTNQIFISYASPDRERVSPYYDWLHQQGLHVWMDCKSIRPGQNWAFEIERALDKSSLVVAFVSQHSYNRRGYVQRELKRALDKLSEKLVDDIYLIPILLDDGIELPDQLKSLQFIRDSDAQGKEKLAEAVTYQLGRLGVEMELVQRQQSLSWRSNVIRESWQGLPGYSFEAELFSFASDYYSNIYQITEFLRGHLLKTLFQCRAERLEQSSDFYNYGQEESRRTNSYDAHCSAPSIKNKILTVQYTIFSYGAGAAHPNHHFETFSFVMDPIVYISSLSDIFSDGDGAFKAVQDAVRRQLLTRDEDGDPMLELDRDQVERGTSSWDSFGAFVFRDRGITLLFAPYAVAAYALGPQTAELTYEEIVKFVRPAFRSALGIEHLVRP